MSQNSDHQPGVYVKGESVRYADTPGRAVALAFEGFVRAADQDPESVSYAEVQAQAKALGLPAKGGKAKLAESVAKSDTQIPAADQGDESTKEPTA